MKWSIWSTAVVAAFLVLIYATGSEAPPVQDMEAEKKSKLGIQGGAHGCPDNIESCKQFCEEDGYMTGHCTIIRGKGDSCECDMTAPKKGGK